MKKLYTIPVSWEMLGYVTVEAENFEEAMEKAMDYPDIPADGQYIYDTWKLEVCPEDEASYFRCLNCKEYKPYALLLKRVFDTIDGNALLFCDEFCYEEWKSKQ